MTDKTDIDLAVACRRAYAEFAGVPVLDLFAAAIGYEMATPEDTEHRGSAFIQRAFTILGWGLPIDDALLARLAKNPKVPAYLPADFLQDRYVATHAGKAVLAHRSALTLLDEEAIEKSRIEIARLGLWNAPDLAGVLRTLQLEVAR